MRRHSRVVAGLLSGVLAASLIAAGPPADRPGQGPGDRERGGPPSWAGPGGDHGADDGADEGDASLEPTDYIALADTLSQPVHDELIEETLRIPTHDGEELSVEITRPATDEPVPVIMEASPYHGTLADYDGIRIFPDPEDEDGNKIGLTGYFAPRGYAVAMVALRGTDRSSGCLDHLGQDDAKDLRDAVEWLAGQEWSDGKVGMTGHSYVGSTPSVAAAMNPEGLVTIAPSAGLASMYDHQFHQGVPWFLQYVGPIFAYEQLALERDLPGGANFEENGPNPQTGCGLFNSAATAGHGQVTGEYQNWHAERDHRAGAAAADIPIFMIHGVNDNAARIPAAEWFFGDRVPREDDKVWIGQWDHGSAGATTCEDADSVGHVNCRFDQWKYALHAWFDKHLKDMDVETGPSVEAFHNGDRVTTAAAWDPTPGTLELFPDATTGALTTQRPEDSGTASFSALAGEGSVEFVSDTFAEETVLRGLPRLDLVASVTGQVVHLVTSLWVEEADGTRRAANYCATNTHLRNDVRTPAAVVPGQPMDLSMQCFTQTHIVDEGERLVLEVGTTSEHHVPSFAHDAQVTVHTGPGTGSYRLPLVEDAELFGDVPLREGEQGDEGSTEPTPTGPAQGPVHETVTLVAPGLGLFGADGVTEASVEFDVEEGFDNARLEARSEAALPADIDLELQRETEDGWETVASGASFDLQVESLATSRPAPGRYRLQVQNWAGGPNQVDALVRFVNSGGEVGGSGSD
jgi:uncharacterized protein